VLYPVTSGTFSGEGNLHKPLQFFAKDAIPTTIKRCSKLGSQAFTGGVTEVTLLGSTSFCCVHLA